MATNNTQAREVGTVDAEDVRRAVSAAKRQAEETTVNVQVTEHGLYEYATKLYTDRRDFLREMLQNSTDGHSTRFSVAVGDTETKLTDNGTGMSREFLEEKFNKVGERFKSGDELRGEFGIGRLSLFQPIAEQHGDKIEYYGHVEIISRDGKRATKLVWNTLPEYTVEDLGPTTEHGTEIRIIAEPNRLPSAEETRAFLEHTMAGVKIGVDVNGEAVKGLDMGVQTFSGTGRIQNMTLRSKHINPSYRYGIGVDATSDSLVIAEKGLRVTELDGMPIGGVMNFSSGSRFGTKVGVKSLSRDTTTLNTSDVRTSFLLNGVIPYYGGMDKAELVQETERMAKIADLLTDSKAWSVKHPSSRSRIGKFIDSIMVHGYSIGDLRLSGNVVYDDLGSSAYIEMAKRRGMMVLEDTSDAVRNALDARGIRAMSDVYKRLEKAEKVDKDGTDDSIALGQLALYIKQFAESMKETFKNKEGSGRPLSESAKAFALWLGHGSKVAAGGIAAGAIKVGAGAAMIPAMLIGAPIAAGGWVRDKIDDIRTHARKSTGERRKRKRAGSSHTIDDLYDALKDLGRDLKDIDLSISTTPKLASGGVKIYLVEDYKKHAGEAAFKRRGGLALNKADPFISEMVEKRRMDQLMPIIVWEYLEKVLKLDTAEGDFTAAYEQVMGRLALKVAKSEVQKTQGIKMSDGVAVVEGARLSKEEAYRLNVSDGSTVQLLLRMHRVTPTMKVVGLRTGQQRAAEASTQDRAKSTT